MSRNYYYLVAGLPDLALDMKKHPMPWSQFWELAQEQLSQADLTLLQQLFLPIDNQNTLNHLLKENKPFIEGGIYSQNEIEEHIKNQTFNERYLNRFVQCYRDESAPNPNLSWEDNLTELFYEFMKNSTNRFISEWFSFNYLLRNVRTALVVRQHKLNPQQYILGNDEISTALKKSTLSDFGLGDDIPVIDKIISIFDNENPLDQEYETDLLRWKYIDEQNTFNYFSTEVVIGFVLKYQIMDRWLKLDPAIGQSMFEQLIQQLKQSYEFPKEFSINERRKKIN
ncbi:MAG TPA: DUF2764 family protein [Salinivirgaceae bacterium]|nr:DUF2764 family protein [Salinivirgaceae bacterium]